MVCFSSRPTQSSAFSLKPPTRPGTSETYPQVTNYFLFPTSSALEPPVREAVSKVLGKKLFSPAQAAHPTNQVPAAVCKTPSGLSSLHFSEKASGEGPCPHISPLDGACQDLHPCTLLLGRHRHAEPTSSQLWKPGESPESPAREPCSGA